MTLRRDNQRPAHAPGVLLSGFMGVGKSTVAPLVAARLGLPAWDLDREVELLCGRSVADIFATEGETAFRDYEAMTLSACLARGPAVGALGGGALLRPSSHTAVVAAGFWVVVLTARRELLEQRLRRDTTRPLAAAWSARYAEREAHYRSLGPAVSVDDRSPDAVADSVVAVLG